MLEPYKPKNSDNRIDVNRGNYCPPHRMGEGVIRLTLRGEKVTNEPCHIHKSRLSRLLHHRPVCLMLHCPHYEEMKSAERRYREKTAKSQTSS